MGCYYIPSETEIGLRPEDFTINDEVVSNKDGSYYYGTTVKPRIFSLACFFENITEQQYAAIQEWLRRDKDGELVFDERPYVSYFVRPNKRIDPRLYISKIGGRYLRTGTFTLELVANNPFGKMKIKSYNGMEDFGATKYTGIVEANKMPLSPTVSSSQFIVYNCGTEKCDTIIRVAGVVDAENGLVIQNTTNGTSCKIVGLEANTLPAGAYLEIDSFKGQVRRVAGDNVTLAFEFHDLGYVRLDPCTPYYRDIFVSYENGSRAVRNFTGAFNGLMKGQYVYLNGGWRYISEVIDENTLNVNANMTATNSEQAHIGTMNTIVVTGNTALTKFEFDYTPIVG